MWRGEESIHRTAPPTTENVLSLSTNVCYVKACGFQIISKTFCVTFIKSLWYLAFILLSATL